MSLKGKNILVLGGSGVVGSGAIYHFLHEGANVVVVSRTDAKLQELLKGFPTKKDNLHGVVGSYETKATVQELYGKVKAALKGASPDHVVSSLGFAALTPTGIADSDLKILTDSFAESLVPSILASQVIIPDIREKEGSTYTIVSGGFAHGCYFPGAWPATIKNAAINAFIMSLASDTEKSKVRTNGCCLHYSVAPPGADKNQMGMPPSQDSHAFGKVFLGFASKADLKGKIVCFAVKEDAEKF